MNSAVSLSALSSIFSKEQWTPWLFLLVLPSGAPPPAFPMAFEFPIGAPPPEFPTALLFLSGAPTLDTSSFSADIIVFEFEF